jgi:hypothetical protein
MNECRIFKGRGDIYLKKIQPKLFDFSNHLQVSVFDNFSGSEYAIFTLEENNIFVINLRQPS